MKVLRQVCSGFELFLRKYDHKMLVKLTTGDRTNLAMERTKKIARLKKAKMFLYGLAFLGQIEKVSLSESMDFS